MTCIREEEDVDSENEELEHDRYDKKLSCYTAATRRSMPSHSVT